jgi:hypothetical protein
MENCSQKYAGTMVAVADGSSTTPEPKHVVNHIKSQRVANQGLGYIAVFLTTSLIWTIVSVRWIPDTHTMKPLIYWPTVSFFLFKDFSTALSLLDQEIC